MGVRRARPRLARHGARDRLINLGIFGAAVVVWVLVALVVTTRDPVAEPVAGFLGAALIGLAVGADHRSRSLWLSSSAATPDRVPRRLDRAARRGAWVGLIVAVFIVLRLQGALELPIALFIVALAVVAEATLSAER